MMETVLWTSPLVQEKAHIVLKLFMYYNTYKHVQIRRILRIMDGLDVHSIIPI